MKTASAQRVRLMDTASITARIEQAIRHAADGNRLINRQREIIAGLEQNGSNVVQALALLKNLLFNQELHLRDRDYLHRLFPQYHP
jgi:hypothetical protein